MTKRWRSFAMLCALCGSTAIAQVRFGPAQPIPKSDTMPTNGSSIRLLGNGNNYFAAWLDERAGEVRQIYGTRLAQDGVALDPIGIRISTTLEDATNFAIGTNGRSYLVIDSSFRTTLIDAVTGQIIERHHPLSLVNLTTGVFEPARNLRLTWLGDQYLAVWGSNVIHAAFVRESGILAEPFDLIPPLYGGGISVLDVVAGDTATLVLFSVGTTELQALLVDRRGAIIARTTIAKNAALPSAATDGHNFFVVWSASLSFDTLLGQSIAPEGTLIGGQIAIAKAAADRKLLNPQVIREASDYLVLFEDVDSSNVGPLRRVTVDTSSGIASAVSTELATPINNFSAAKTNTSGLVVFAGPSFERHLFSKRLGATSDQVPVGLAPSSDVRPQVAANDETTVVVWQRWPFNPPRGTNTIGPVFGSVSSGNAPFSAPVLLSNADEGGYTATIAAGRSTFLAAWHIAGAIRYRILGTHGERTSAIRSLPSQASFNVTWNGSEYLVTTFAPVQVFSINENGDVVHQSEPIPTTSPLLFPGLGTLACNDTTCVAAWIVFVFGPCPGGACPVQSIDVQSSRFTRGGTLIDAQPRVLARGLTVTQIALTNLGDSFVAAWQGDGIRAMRLTPQGLPEPETEIRIGSDVSRNDQSIALTSTGGAAVLAWSRGAGGQGFVRFAVIGNSPIGLRSGVPETIEPLMSAHDVSLDSVGGRILLAYEGLSPDLAVPTIYVRATTPVRQRTVRR